MRKSLTGSRWGCCRGRGQQIPYHPKWSICRAAVCRRAVWSLHRCNDRGTPPCPLCDPQNGSMTGAPLTVDRGINTTQRRCIILHWCVWLVRNFKNAHQLILRIQWLKLHLFSFMSINIFFNEHFHWILKKYNYFKEKSEKKTLANLAYCQKINCSRYNWFLDL